MLCNRDLLRDMAVSVASVLLELVGYLILQKSFLFAKWYLQSCSDEHVHVAEEQAHPQHGGHRHIFPGQASPKTFSFSYVDVTLLEEPLLVNRLWANIDEKVPSVRKC